MISIVRLVGESFDFQTMKETPKAVVLSNGKREVSIFVDEATAIEIVRLFVEDENPEVHVEPVTPESRPVQVPMTNETVDLRQPPHDEETTVDTEKQKTLEWLESEAQKRQAGTEYNDRLTGVSSL